MLQNHPGAPNPYAGQIEEEEKTSGHSDLYKKVAEAMKKKKAAAKADETDLFEKPPSQGSDSGSDK